MRLCNLDIGIRLLQFILPALFSLISLRSDAIFIKIEAVEQKCSEILTVSEPIPGRPLSFSNPQELNNWLTLNLLKKYKLQSIDTPLTGLTPETRANEVLNRLLRFRISFLPEDRQQALLNILDSSVLIFEFPFAVWGSHGFASPGEISVKNHLSLRDSAFTLAILIHEIEHQIQFLLFPTSDFKRWKREQGLHLFAKKTLLRYQQETGAMFMEWAFFHLLPHDDLSYWQAKLDSAGDPTYPERDMLVFRDRDRLQRQLDGASLSFEEYLALEHKAGRYSLRSIRELYWRERDGEFYHPY
ncbi:MAG: hypothetical protein AB7N80_02715 [Bdellovibrionales bacterium]